MSRDGGRSRKEILEAEPTRLSGPAPHPSPPTPGMEPQGPRAAQRQDWAENLAPWLPGRPSPKLRRPGLGKA